MTHSTRLPGRFRRALSAPPTRVHVLSRLSVHLLCNELGSIAECNKFHFNLHLLAERRGGHAHSRTAPPSNVRTRGKWHISGNVFSAREKRPHTQRQRGYVGTCCASVSVVTRAHRSCDVMADESERAREGEREPKSILPIVAVFNLTFLFTLM